MIDPQPPPGELPLAGSNTPADEVPPRSGEPADVDRDARDGGDTDDGRLTRNRAFLAVWSASTISIFGSLITRQALPFAAILVLAAGPLEISALRSAELIAGLIVGLVAGAWVDRLRRRPILIWADLGRAALLASVPVAFVFGVLGLAQLLIVAFAAAVLTTFFDVADNAYLPTVVSRKQLLDANSALTATGSVAEFSAFGIAGLLIEWLKAPIAIAVDALTFVVSALLLATIRKKEPAPIPHAEREPVLREIREGIGIVARSPILRALALSHGGTHVVWGVTGVGYLLFAIDLGLGPAAITAIAAVGGIGSLAGAALAPVMVRRFGIGPTMLIGMLGFAAGSALIPLAPAGLPLLGASFLIGQQLLGDSMGTVYEVTEVSLQQASVDSRVLGRVNASFHTFTTLMTLLGAVAGGFLAEAIGLRMTFWIGLVGAVLSIVAVWFSPVRRIRDAPLRPTIGTLGTELTIAE